VVSAFVHFGAMRKFFAPWRLGVEKLILVLNGGLTREDASRMLPARCG
jgi:hypothetical protein